MIGKENNPENKPKEAPSTKGKMAVRHYIKQNTKIPHIANDVLLSYLRKKVGAFGLKAEYDREFEKWMNTTRSGKKNLRR